MARVHLRAGGMSDDAALPYLTVAGVLRELARAGDEGLVTGELARRFAFRESYDGEFQRQLAEVNSILEGQARNGRVRKSEWLEPSAHYHHAPSRRWFITGHGRQYAQAGGRQGIARIARAARLAAEAERAARKEQRQRAREDAAVRLGAVLDGSMAARDGVIRELRAEGVLSLEDIGRAAGLSRERVHQIVRAKEVRAGEGVLRGTDARLPAR